MPSVTHWHDGTALLPTAPRELTRVLGPAVLFLYKLTPADPSLALPLVREGSISSDNALPCTGCPGESPWRPLALHVLFLSGTQQAKMTFSILLFQKVWGKRDQPEQQLILVKLHSLHQPPSRHRRWGFQKKPGWNREILLSRERCSLCTQISAASDLPPPFWTWLLPSKRHCQNRKTQKRLPLDFFASVDADKVRNQVGMSEKGRARPWKICLLFVSLGIEWHRNHRKATAERQQKVLSYF